MSKKKKSTKASSSSQMKVKFENGMAILFPHAVKIETWSKKDKQSLKWKPTDLHSDVLLKPQIHCKRNAKRVLVVTSDADGNMVSIPKNVSGQHFFVQVGSGEPFQLASKVLRRVKRPRKKPGARKDRPDRYSVRVPIEVKTEAVSLANQAGISESQAAIDLAIESLSIGLGLPVVKWCRGAVPEDKLVRGLREWDFLLDCLARLEGKALTNRYDSILGGCMAGIDPLILEHAKLAGLLLAPLNQESAFAARGWVINDGLCSPACLRIVESALGCRTDAWSKIRRCTQSKSERRDNVLTFEIRGLLCERVEADQDKIVGPLKTISDKFRGASKQGVFEVLLRRLLFARQLHPPSCQRFQFFHPCNKIVYGAFDRKLEKLTVALRRVSSALCRKPCRDPRLLNKQFAAVKQIDTCIARLEFRRRQVLSVPVLAELGLSDLSRLRGLALRARAQAEQGNADAAAAANLLDYLTGFESAEELAAIRRDVQ
ncbi:hypothetical protein QEH56_14485 [Pelagicoccus enzymogenes]|uniref:hypothetical protein n=1 Tax=Pelagicoccus enzymogenes TaxID=2773457 RepID=UPI00280E2F47|nr:hypothetical protein [Pelagicoccus enzymogenes]MDQ8199370.1 hypothetical protein [Pelagicoccus enzymogenes]